MTDRAQFEAMLEALINEDQETAKEIFHNIVVAKSREIYEELLESDFGAEEEEEGEEEGEEEEGEEEEEGGDDFGGDAGDDFVDDVEDGDEEGGEEELEDRVMDLEDALEELKAEFEQLMADEGNEPEHHDGMDDPDFGGDMGDEMGADMEADEGYGMEEEGSGNVVHHVHHGVFEAATLEKVAPPKHGDNGANAKSPVGPGANMGGTTANIARGGQGGSGGTQGGLASPKPQDMNTGNINVVGGNAGKTAFKKKEPGHGPEKKGPAEGGLIGAGTGEKNTGSVDKSSIISGKRVR